MKSGSICNRSKHLTKGCVTAIALTLTSAMACRGGTILRVAPDGDDALDGSDWGANAKRTITNALTVAVGGDEIWVRAGLYKPAAGAARTLSFVMKSGVDLYGGFAGTETARAQRDWTNNPTLLCGEIQDDGLLTNNSYHVVVGANARLDGFTIRNGCANGTSANASGGGMYSSKVSPVTANCLFTNNWTAGSAGKGGAVFWDQGDYTVRTAGWYNCVFAYNSATGSAYYAGGLYANFYTNTLGAISNCVFIGNRAYGNIAGHALTLYDSGKKTWSAGAAYPVIDTVFEKNLSNYRGAIYAYNFVSPLIFQNCRFLANTNTYNSSTGGGAMTLALNAAGAGVRMLNCRFEANACGVGGAVWFDGGAGTNSLWRDCVFTNNTSFGASGAALAGAVDGTFERCRFEGHRNTSYGSGAVAINGVGHMKNDLFTNCVFRRNTAGTSGQGAAVYTTVVATFRDCHFAENQIPSYVRGGGAIYWSVPGTDTGLIVNCTFTTNATPGGGGSILHDKGTLHIRASEFIANSAGGYYYVHGGGAIWQRGGALTLSDCTFKSNSATGHGGAICRSIYNGGTWNTTLPSVIQRSIFLNNKSTGANKYGGAIAFATFAGETGRVFNCIFKENRGVRGGAIATENASVAISNVTAVANDSTTAGYGGALSHNGSGYEAQVANAIFWNNSPVEIAPTAGVTVRYSNVSGGFAGEGNLAKDPKFADATYLHLQSPRGVYVGGWFGGGSWTTTPGRSPLIDKGDPASPYAAEHRPNGGNASVMGGTGYTDYKGPNAYYNKAGDGSVAWLAVHGTVLLVR